MTNRHRRINTVSLSIGAAVIVDQLATLVPSFVHLASVQHTQRSLTSGIRFDDPTIRLSQHMELVNVLHSAPMTGTFLGDHLARLGLASLCIYLALRPVRGWIERYVLRTLFILIAATGISQSLSFAVQHGVVDWLAFTTHTGTLLVATTLSDLYVPLSLLLVFLAGLISAVFGMTDLFVKWARSSIHGRNA